MPFELSIYTQNLPSLTHSLLTCEVDGRKIFEQIRYLLGYDMWLQVCARGVHNDVQRRDGLFACHIRCDATMYVIWFVRRAMSLTDIRIEQGNVNAL